MKKNILDGEALKRLAQEIVEDAEMLELENEIEEFHNGTRLPVVPVLSRQEIADRFFHLGKQADSRPDGAAEQTGNSAGPAFETTIKGVLDLGRRALEFVTGFPLAYEGGFFSGPDTKRIANADRSIEVAFKESTNNSLVIQVSTKEPTLLGAQAILRISSAIDELMLANERASAFDILNDSGEFRLSDDDTTAIEFKVGGGAFEKPGDKRPAAGRSSDIDEFSDEDSVVKLGPVEFKQYPEDWLTAKFCLDKNDRTRFSSRCLVRIEILGESR